MFEGETLQLPLPDGPGKALKLDDRAGAGADADLPRRDRAEEHDAGAPRSPTAGSRRCSRPSTSASSGRCSRRASRAPAAARASTTSTSPRRVNVFVTDDLESARDAMRPVRRALRRRHGLAQAELLQRARAALRLRGRRARGPGPLPRGQEGRGGGGAAGRADRHASRCAGRRRRARAAGGVPRRGRRHADGRADGVDVRGPAARSCGSWPSWPLEDLPRRLRRPGPRVPDARARGARWSRAATRWL